MIDGDAEGHGHVERRLDAAHGQGEYAVTQGQQPRIDAGTLIANDERQRAGWQLRFV
jgi:hypothetical protein